VHAMMDAFSGVTEFMRMTPARVHDRQFLLKLNSRRKALSYLIKHIPITGSSVPGVDNMSGLYPE
jgi:hypothetical protein